MRTYVVFGSNDDNENFRLLGEVKASTHDQAQDKAREEYEGWEHYGSTTKRNWVVRKPSVRTVVDWEIVIPGQLTVDDELGEEEEDEPEDDVVNATDELLERAEAELRAKKAETE